MIEGILLILGLGGIIISLISKVLKFAEVDEGSKGYGLFAICANVTGMLAGIFGYFQYLSFSINGSGLIPLPILYFFSSLINLGFLINNVAVFKAKIRYERYEKYIKHCKNSIYENSDISDEVKSELCNIVGYYYINLNQCYDANHYFQKALDYNPNNKVAKEHISTIEQKTNKTEHTSEYNIVTTVPEISEETRKHICSIPVSLWKKISNKTFLLMYYQVVAGKIANKIENKKELADSDCTNAMEILELVSQHEPDLLNEINES